MITDAISTRLRDEATETEVATPLKDDAGYREPSSIRKASQNALPLGPRLARIINLPFLRNVHDASLPDILLAATDVPISGTLLWWTALIPHHASELLMPYTRPIRRFYLTPPKLWTFIISVVLAIVAVLAVYGHFAPLHPINGFLTLLIAWIILVAGVLVRGI